MWLWDGEVRDGEVEELKDSIGRQWLVRWGWGVLSHSFGLSLDTAQQWITHTVGQSNPLVLLFWVAFRYSCSLVKYPDCIQTAVR
jgi:hypothetical protein